MILRRRPISVAKRKLHGIRPDAEGCRVKLLQFADESFCGSLISGLRHLSEPDMQGASFQLQNAADLQQITEALRVVTPVWIDSHPAVQGHAPYVVGGCPHDIQDPFL